MLAPNELKPLDLPVSDHEEVEVACHEPWLIAYSRPRAQAVAKQSLERIGYECWYPIRKIVTTRPLRTISSKTRHKRRYEAVERFEAALGCYLLIRELRPVTMTCNLYELDGVGGICRFGEKAAMLTDFQVEMLRLAEADGKFNEYAVSVPFGYRVSAMADPRPTFEKKQQDKNPRQYNGCGRDLGHRVDRYGESVHFVERLGRVLRLIQTAQPPATQ